MKSIFSKTNILLPNENVSPGLWSVIACDQFTSQNDYWERVKQTVGTMPSTLNMIIPEVTLGRIDESDEINKICSCMNSYINQGLFRDVKDSYIYVERTLPDGMVRKGLVGIVDLEEYDFTGTGNAAILASEGTVLDRLPPRIRVRESAALELPHIIALIADAEKTVIEPVSSISENLPLLYDFKLMENGGYLKGYKISGEDAKNIENALNTIYENSRDKNPHLCRAPRCFMIVGDGNHSLAAAKTYWNNIKSELSINELSDHPARYALLEVNNLYDPAVRFEAIHRVVFNIDADNFINALLKEIPAGNDFVLKLLTFNDQKDQRVSASSASDIIAKVQAFLDDYVINTGGSIDYIHNENAVKELIKENNCVGILLPVLSKPEFLDTVAAGRIFPRKSFSIGHAEEKRYYMECRKIK